jgi:hypothetical protein
MNRSMLGWRYIPCRRTEMYLSQSCLFFVKSVSVARQSFPSASQCRVVQSPSSSLLPLLSCKPQQRPAISATAPSKPRPATRRAATIAPTLLATSVARVGIHVYRMVCVKIPTTRTYIENHALRVTGMREVVRICARTR